MNQALGQQTFLIIQLNHLLELPFQISQKNEQDGSSQLLDETKKNIERAAEEATTLTANFAEAISSCQNQNIHIVKEFAEIYVDMQRRFVNSFEKSWVPYWEKTVTSLYSELFSPQRFSELYTNFLSKFQPKGGIRGQ